MRNHYDGRFGSGRFWHLKSNRRPEDEYDSDCNYCDGDSENWTDSSDEEEDSVLTTVSVPETVNVALVEPIVVPKKVTTWASIAAKNINK